MTVSDPSRGSGDAYPGNFGVLPVVPPDFPDKNPRTNAATAATAAGARAFTAQAIAFYFRAPVKAFFRTRVDYLAYARNLQQQNHSYLSHLGDAANPGNGGSQSWWQWLRSVGRSSTPGVLASAVRHYGWRIIPDQVIPPLIANVGVGAVLYTSYLQILGRLHEESGKATRRVYPPPQPVDTFTAGFLAGSFQSVVAAPLDAIQARFERGGKGPEIINENGRPQSMWTFGYAKLREIGVRGIFAGWGLSFAKDGLGSAIFFSTFEYVKAQAYYNFVGWYYGSLSADVVHVLSRQRPAQDADGDQPTTIRPHYAIEPAFLMLAGFSASMAQQTVIHPLTHIQMEHWEHLEYIDAQARKIRRHSRSDTHKSKWRWRMFRAYYHAYQETWAQCLAETSATEGNGPNALRRWIYRGFWWNTIRQVPSTSAGLIIFELVRRKYGMGGEQVRITRDGYDILLS